MNENDQPTGPGPGAAGQHPQPGPPAPAAGPPPAPAVTHPQPGPAAPAAARPRGSRASLARDVLTSRGAGWAVAAILAGAVAGLSIVLASAPPGGLVAVAGPAGPVQFRLPPGAGRISIVPGGPGAIRRQILAVPGLLAPGAMRIAGLGPGVFGGQLMSPFGQVVAGTVSSVSGSTFTIAAGGQTVTVQEQPSTVYRQTGNPASASAVTKGARVAVLGTLSGSKMTAAAVSVLSG